MQLKNGGPLDKDWQLEDGWISGVKRGFPLPILICGLKMKRYRYW